VLDQDIMMLPADKILTARVVATYVGSTPVNRLVAFRPAVRLFGIHASL
jgi:hypothetical protein